MLIRNDDGTYTGGPLDAIVILRDVEGGRYHVTFFEEAPMPGAIRTVGDLESVRLKSKMHHTVGAPDLVGAQGHARKLMEGILLPKQNVALEEAIAWDGVMGIVLCVPNWRRTGAETTLDHVLRHASARSEGTTA